jgi:hypothetical protein
MNDLGNDATESKHQGKPRVALPSAQFEHVDGLLRVPLRWFHALEQSEQIEAMQLPAYKRRFSSISIKDRTGLDKAKQDKSSDDCNHCSLARLEHVDGLLRVLELVPALEQSEQLEAMQLPPTSADSQAFQSKTGQD